MMSHPTRMRGLKWNRYGQEVASVGVASYADAWIEIHVPRVAHASRAVASYADAWIEIYLRDAE